MRVLFLIIIFVNLNADDLQIIKDMVSDIVKTSDKSESKKSSAIPNPFFIKNKSIKIQKDENGTIVDILPKKEMILYAIFQDSAKIDDKWYRVGDFVNGKKIIDIGLRSVTLYKQKSKKIYLKGVNGITITAE